MSSPSRKLLPTWVFRTNRAPPRKISGTLVRNTCCERAYTRAIASNSQSDLLSQHSKRLRYFARFQSSYQLDTLPRRRATVAPHAESECMRLYVCESPTAVSLADSCAGHRQPEMTDSTWNKKGTVSAPVKVAMMTWVRVLCCRRKQTGRNNHRALIAPGCQTPKVQHCATTHPKSLLQNLQASSPPLRRSSGRSCATAPSSYGSWPTPCPTGWASTIFFDCRVGCALLPIKWGISGALIMADRVMRGSRLGFVSYE